MKKGILGVLIVIMLSLAGATGFFLGSKGGERRGREIELENGREAVEKMIEIVSEKDALQGKFNAVTPFFAFSVEQVKDYKSEIENIYTELSDEEAKKHLGEYLGKVTELLEMYEGGDLVAIQFEFFELREKAKECADALNQLFVSRLENAVKESGFYL